MENVQQLMMKLISSCFNNEKLINISELSEETLEKLYSLSVAHDLAHLVSYTLFKNGLIDEGSDLGKAFYFSQYQALLRYEGIKYELDKICALLENNQIEFLPLKGSVIRKLYPEPWMRTSGDIDILIHEQELDKCIKELSGNSEYEFAGKASHDVSFFTKAGVYIELHYNLIEDTYKYSDLLSEVWDNANPEENCKYHMRMSDEMFYFYHIAHMAKHFENGGCGVRTFVDLWLLNGKENSVPEKYVPILEKGGLTSFARESSRLAGCWFNGGSHSALTLQMEQYVVYSGVYGSLENSVAARQIKLGGKFKNTLNRIFIPYEKLKYAYPILQSHKFLLPVYEVLRWFNLIFKGRLGYSIHEMGINYSMSDSQKNNIEDMFKKLNLLN